MFFFVNIAFSYKYMQFSIYFHLDILIKISKITILYLLFFSKFALLDIYMQHMWPILNTFFFIDTYFCRLMVLDVFLPNMRNYGQVSCQNS